ncbi:Clf1p [Lachancea thermotolerans CBS 6340]|uniref:Pre-mRNA-splicing factor CLF1 n=1 Tax=Lachancea thermotolerans (strain ATCC 56472 / CBS 6340 / NRRL Y-8284) TaxID=559295 RepID=C5DMY1_LACTC|nr:KLTH0G12562p [Lachancea thermotolerans CBS 6340]CAR25142.1 KLTH0G12562p [Lachancea thermotolerans CBS 6340]
MPLGANIHSLLEFLYYFCVLWIYPLHFISTKVYSEGVELVKSKLNHMEPEPVQISADSLLRGAFDQKAPIKPTTKVEILDLEELKEYQRRKRSEFENVLKVKRHDIKQWARYAKFELDQRDMRRARSVFERALQINNAYVPLWIKYIDSELKARNVNHARNLLNRATNLLPRVGKLWLKYVIVEESLNNTDIVRQLFAKWCSLGPGKNAFDAYVDFEIRHGNFENVRKVYGRYVLAHPEISTWLKWVAFEKKHGDSDTTRQVLSLGLDTFSLYEISKDSDIASLVGAYAEWEATQQEYERSSALFDLASQRWPHNGDLERRRVQFEKMYGTSTNVNDSITSKRKREYEIALSNDPKDYDTWWIYLDLLQKHYPNQAIPGFHKSVTGNAPDGKVKNLSWERYIYLWLRCLTYFELDVSDLKETRRMYKRLIKEVIPHKSFTFAKVWVMYAKFELRQGDIMTARKILGQALGICPKNKIFKYYIELEIQLKEFDRVRKIYEQYIAFNALESDNWLAYAELEDNLGDEERARGIFHIALSDKVGLDTNERFKILEQLITFETNAGEYAKARQAYDALVQLSGYSPTTYIERAMFESTIPADNLSKDDQSQNMAEGDEDEPLDVTEANKRNSRSIFNKALDFYKEQGDKESRCAMLRALNSYEAVHGTVQTREAARKRLPKRRTLTKRENNVEVEYTDYEFPEDEEGEVGFSNNDKLLALAQKWKQGNT